MKVVLPDPAIPMQTTAVASCGGAAPAMLEEMVQMGEAVRKVKLKAAMIPNRQTPLKS